MKTLRPITTSIIPRIYAPAIPSRRAATRIPAYGFLHTNHNRIHQQTRTFLSNPFANSTGPQTISATRTLPYPSQQIFDIITDVSSYHHYFPFCIESTVTKTSKPASNGKKYPEEAKLIVGVDWHGNSVREEFSSRVYCVPDRVVEAVSGKTETSLLADEIRHHNPRPEGGEDMTRQDEMVEHLLTRWTLRPLGQRGGKPDETEVNLQIEVQFANPIYAALSQAAVPKVAEKMIEAFERRVGDVVSSDNSDKNVR